MPYSLSKIIPYLEVSDKISNPLKLYYRQASFQEQPFALFTFIFFLLSPN